MSDPSGNRDRILQSYFHWNRSSGCCVPGTVIGDGALRIGFLNDPIAEMAIKSSLSKLDIPENLIPVTTDTVFRSYPIEVRIV
ncbi:MAG: hypothetical protein RQ801_01190 [Spirochaetaceae bacterium]|nr:hypothetical protein [Spirochaetaceae bacterium]MDT8296885.1 hypothetical protein [Spirochaetaceae bacterium]